MAAILDVHSPNTYYAWHSQAPIVKVLSGEFHRKLLMIRQIGPANVLVPSDNKSFPNQQSTQIYVAIWRVKLKCRKIMFHGFCDAFLML